MRKRYDKGEFHEDVESILKDVQKEYIEVDGPEKGGPWDKKYYRKKISEKEKILVVASANVAVDAVIFCCIENWPGAKVLKIGCASRDSRLDGYCLETLCKAIPNWADLEEETKKAHIDAFIMDADIIFSTCASC